VAHKKLYGNIPYTMVTANGKDVWIMVNELYYNHGYVHAPEYHCFNVCIAWWLLYPWEFDMYLLVKHVELVWFSIVICFLSLNNTPTFMLYTPYLQPGMGVTPDWTHSLAKTFYLEYLW